MLNRNHLNINSNINCGLSKAVKFKTNYCSKSSWINLPFLIVQKATVNHVLITQIRFFLTKNNVKALYVSGSFAKNDPNFTVLWEVKITDLDTVCQDIVKKIDSLTQNIVVKLEKKSDRIFTDWIPFFSPDYGFDKPSPGTFYFLGANQTESGIKRAKEHYQTFGEFSPFAKQNRMYWNTEDVVVYDKAQQMLHSDVFFLLLNEKVVKAKLTTVGIVFLWMLLEYSHSNPQQTNLIDVTPHWLYPTSGLVDIFDTTKRDWVWAVKALVGRMEKKIMLTESEYLLDNQEHRPLKGEVGRKLLLHYVGVAPADEGLVDIDVKARNLMYDTNLCADSQFDNLPFFIASKIDA